MFTPAKAASHSQYGLKMVGEREAEQDHEACEAHHRLIERHEVFLVFGLADSSGASHAGAQ